MVNKNRGEVEVSINGKGRVLVFDNNTVAELEELFGTAPIAVLRDLADTMQRDALAGKAFSTIRAFMWAGLHQKTPGLKIEAVGRAMLREEFPQYLQACSHGLMAAYGIDQEKIAAESAKREKVADAKKKLEAGEELTEEEADAIGEAPEEDPLALVDLKPRASQGPSPT